MRANGGVFVLCAVLSVVLVGFGCGSSASGGGDTGSPSDVDSDQARHDADSDLLSEVAGDTDQPGCKGDDECGHLITNACQSASCDIKTGQCTVVDEEDCRPCSEQAECDKVEIDPGPCLDLLCQEGRCVIGNAADGKACSDGDACTTVDQCDGGQCVGAQPVVCEALDQCHVAGQCDSATGQCSNPSIEEATPCDDGDACTQVDTCVEGVCVGAQPVVCQALDQCHVAGQCDSATGQCSNPNIEEATPCDDGDACTQVDSCVEGVCVGAQPLVCEALDQCHVAGQCDSATGQCSNPNIDDGSGCDDGDLCTQVDSCQEGVCTGADPVACPPKDQCHVEGVCQPETGLCQDVKADEMTACDDGDACTLADACVDGVCTVQATVECLALDQCHVVGLCDSATGICSDPPAADETACNDENACTQLDWCQSGACVGTDPVVCVAMDQCHVVGVCDPETGVCSDPMQEDGYGCDDGDACTQSDGCLEGVCTGADPVQCVALDQCHVVGVCDPETGVCSDPNAENNTPCDDSDACSQADFCQGGVCVGADFVLCNDYEGCTTDYCEAGVCVFDFIDGCVPEICDNGMDDNENLKVDCDDPLCEGHPSCESVVGETCGNPILVNDGKVVGPSFNGQTLTFEGSTTGMADDYMSNCAAFPGAGDVVYRLLLTQPMQVTATATFTNATPEFTPVALLSLYSDICFPSEELECSYAEEEMPASITVTLTGGEHFFVVDGPYPLDAGPYVFTLTFTTPPTTETSCSDGMDNDADSHLDCFDPDCYGHEDCPECIIQQALQCGDTFFGDLANHEDTHWFTFNVPSNQPIAVTVLPTSPSGTDQYNINFKEGPVSGPCEDLYSVGGTTIYWIPPNTRGFDAKSSKSYVVMVTANQFGYMSGQYTLQFQCGGSEPESACDDGTDNDLDSWIDCEDPDCFDALECTGGFTGESCSTAFQLNDGDALALADLGEDGLHFTHNNTTVNRAKNLSASCSPSSAQGPDMVYRFEVLETMDFSASVEFEDISQRPALYLFQNSCDASGLVGCGEGFFFIAGVGATLEPGIYFVVVDSGAVGIDGIPDRSNYLVDFWFDPPSTPEICDNVIDDDGDGDNDCMDSQCFNHASCTLGHAGDNCDDPFVVPQAQPSDVLPIGAEFIIRNSTAGKASDGSFVCDYYWIQGPDTFTRFTLDQSANVTLTLLSGNGSTMGLRLLDSPCATGTELSCAVTPWDADSTTLSQNMAPGTYYIQLVSTDYIWGQYITTDYTLTITTTDPQ